MNKLKKIINNCILPVIDIAAIPFTVLVAIFMRGFREVETREMRSVFTKKLFLKIGVWPLLDHYYEPLFHTKYLRHSLRDIRFLPGIELNEKSQIDLLRQFNYADELKRLPAHDPGVEGKFYFDNPSFGSGDSEILYSMIRRNKPKKIVEVGSGFSTLMAKEAIRCNEMESGGVYECQQICIEPYEMPWLEKTGVTVIRKKLEDVDKSLFLQLEENDILFIDSSHIIRPQGDVLTEYLELLPMLNLGVLIHFHDIFTPRDYLDEWLYKRVRFWNEQYLMEAFLSCNKEFQVIMAVNHMKNSYYECIKACCPMLRRDREPGSFWIQKIQPSLRK